MSMNEPTITIERGRSMRSRHVLAALAALTAIAIVSTDASAYYHPTVGRFLQRDPGPGGPIRTGAAAAPATGGDFAQRDPIRNQYADGPNLYQYVRSSPLNYVDCNGAQATRPGSPSTGSQSGSTTATAPTTISLGIKWTPNTDTGDDSRAWGVGPNGDMLEAKTNAGTTVTIWRPHDGSTYWCHGYTFDGHIAQGGPYSTWGDQVPKVLGDGGWKQVPCSWTVCRKDIVVFWQGDGPPTHSGKVWADLACEWPSMRFAERCAKIRSKWGQGALNTSTFAANVQSYGKYRCYSQEADKREASAEGACECWGENELKP